MVRKNMINIFIDIETGPDKTLIETYTENIKPPKSYKDEEKIKEYIENAKLEAIKKMAIDWDYSEIRCIGCKVEDEDPKLISLKEFGEIWNNGLSRIIGFNIKKFDLPVLIRNGIKNGVEMPYKALHEASKNRYSPKVIDLMEELGNYGDWKSLDQYLQIYLGIKKTPIDFETCTQEELENHCLEDVCNSEKLFKKFNNLF